ncbi:MAG: class I SAM-dependent methyltransferase [Methanobacteriota archaeon]
MVSDPVDPASYPLAWDESYSKKGPQWRGGLNLSKYLEMLDLSGAVIEMGAGNGNAAGKLANAMPAGSRLVCFDVSKKALMQFSQRLRNDGRVFSAVADARATPFREGSFNSVLVRHVLTHAIPGDESRILSEVRRLLSKNGRALVEVFTPEDMRHGKGRDLAPGVFLHGGGLVWRFFSEGDIREAVAKAGLEILELDVVSRHVTFRGKRYLRESIVAIVSRE